MIFAKNIKFCCLHLYRKLHSDVRVRFAPSPTGFLHLGGLRTAFYNYLFAKKNKGSFILRIEDTDQKRVKPGSVENLLSMLKWTGLFPDESPEVGGPYAPYTQSERLKMYKEKTDILLQSGAAYRCFCSELRLNLLKKEAHLKNLNRGYDNKCRSLIPSEEKELLSKNTPFTIRFKIPEGQVIHRDMVYGESAYNLSDIEGDFVILKSDGFPTYHFSCVVDDHLMKISHVLRGTEWLISTPKHILLHQSFGWTPPKYAHLPLLINSDRTKLSKRQDSIGVEYFKNKGYYPESLLNFLAVAGGGFGRQEGCFVYDLDVLTSKFQLENVNTNPCILDIRKLDLFNHNYIVKQLSNERTALSVVRQLRSILKEKYGQRYDIEKKNLPDSYLLRILKMHKDRVNNLYDFVEKDMEYLWTSSDFKMVEELKVSQSILHGWKKVLVLLSTLSESEYSQEVLAVGLKDICTKYNIPYVPFMKSLRIVFAGQKVGPGISEILVMLGKQRCTNKISKVLEKMDKSKMSGCM